MFSYRTSASDLQNSILNPDSNVGELGQSALPKDLLANKTNTVLTKHCDASDGKQGSLQNKTVICHSNSSNETVASHCVQISKYQCPLCSFYSYGAQGLTNHLEDAHHVMGLKPKLSEGSTKSSNVDHSKNSWSSSQ